MNTTTRSTNQATYQRLYDAIGSRDLGQIARTVDELFHPDAVFHGGPPDAESAGAAVKTAWTMLLKAFPDISVTVEDTIAEADKVVFRNTVTGTHRGDYRGLPATGKKINYSEMFIIRFADGKVAEGWGIVDLYSQLQQLGVRS
ncbi:ester cyclase [Microlunatus soli]|uniref:SnoaL-like polyketide cyclase n=1 Tax=Microlunatus soli TaxID=630515 RepID=A0A1H1YW39_9ACTN|nr:ester cyclase [Microlunatus soli]SDT25640.1 conserved hypothetical protein, steroid delta-isomerase-related [Microlunatus soli]